MLFSRPTIKPGEEWMLDDRESGPWESTRFKPVKVIDVKAGWVRYFVSEIYPDERMKIGTFVRLYRKVKCPRWTPQ